MTYVVSMPPSAEPLTRDVVKAHMRVDHADEDGVIDALIVAGREYVENYLKRPLITQTINLTLDCFPGEITINRQPVQSISSVSYVDTDGLDQVVLPADYLSDLSSEPARVAPAYGESWPSTRSQNNAVTIQFVAGYGLTEVDVPQSIRHAMLLLISHWYENREAVMVGVNSSELPMAVKALLATYMVHEF